MIQDFLLNLDPSHMYSECIKNFKTLVKNIFSLNEGELCIFTVLLMPYFCALLYLSVHSMCMDYDLGHAAHCT
jgi:hypothetical protein